MRALGGKAAAKEIAIKAGVLYLIGRVSLGLAASYEHSLLDEDSLALLEQLAVEHNLQVWVERVGKNDKTAVIIEDGTVWERDETTQQPAA